MALAAANIVEVRNGGSDSNAGFFNPGNANFPTDLAATNANTSSPVVTSASYTFVTGDVGAWVFVKSGTNWTPGWYQIASVSAGAATLSAAIGAAILANGNYPAGTNTAAGCATTASPTGGTWGADYSQQNAAQIAFTDMIIGATTTQFTSVANPVGKNMVGNGINVTAGTGFTVQRVEVVSVATITATCDKSLGTTASTGGTGNLGGCLATVTVAVNTVAVGSNAILVKYNASAYTTATTLTPPAGALTAPTIIQGYNSTRGDITGPSANAPTIQLAAAVFLITASNNYLRLRYLILDCNSQTSSRAVSQSGGAGHVYAFLVVKNFTAGGIVIQSDARHKVYGCLATGGTSAATLGAFYAQVDGPIFERCAAVGNACKGFYNVASSVHFIGNVSANNSGASSDGFFIDSAGFSGEVTGNVSYNNGRDGIRFNAAGGAVGVIRNNILAKNAGYGWNSSTTNWVDYDDDYNFYWSNTSGARNQIVAGPHDVTGSGDPFANPSGSVTTLADVWANFAPNATAGAGAACRGAGYPAYIDIGAVQHQDAGGGGTTIIVNRVTNNFLVAEPV